MIVRTAFFAVLAVVSLLGLVDGLTDMIWTAALGACAVYARSFYNKLTKESNRDNAGFGD